MRFARALVLIFGVAVSKLYSHTPFALFDDLELIKKINTEIKDELPFFYNYSMVGGYFNMPSARMPPSGYLGIGAARATPYNVYGINFQPFSRIELVANYRVYRGMIEQNFGNEGFGDDADRIGSIKIAILSKNDGIHGMPSLVFGADDFFGTGRFNSQYVVMTQQWKEWHLEASLGWGHGRMRGWFGGVGWTPLRRQSICFLNNISLIAEYDNINYSKHHWEHRNGRVVKNRVNFGLSYVGWEMLQASISTVRGTDLAGSASFRYPLGSTHGLFMKVNDSPHYVAPIDTEPLGLIRNEKEFGQELAYACADQGLDLYSLYLYDTLEGKELWMKIVNNRYRQEEVVRGRLQDLLAALTPADVVKITIVIDADALPTQSYVFRAIDLHRFRQGKIGVHELEVLSPMVEAIARPPGGTHLFERHRDIWTFTFRPRLLTFFGSATGKFKYNIGLMASQEGYLFDAIYYKLQAGYSIHSTAWSIRDIDKLNPSQLPNVRTDTIRYYQNNSVALEKAYLQKSLNLGRGWYYRLAGGYFEIAYGGIGMECLFYPVNSRWAVGVSGAVELKRRYTGIAFTHKIRQLHGYTPEMVHFIGLQGFLNIYYEFTPLQLDFILTAGQFLAKDKGARLSVGRTFASGLQIYLWYTVTNAHDKVNGRTYYDKGFAFAIPLDIFLRQSSRNFIGYAMSAWLRDVGAIAESGKPLYGILREERYINDLKTVR